MGKKYQISVTLDYHQEGMILAALNEVRNRQLAEGKLTDLTDEVLIKILNAPYRKKGRMRDEAR